MATFAGNKNAPALLHKDLHVGQQIMGTYNIAQDGNAIGTQKLLGVAQAGTLFDPTALRCHIEEAFDGTTPLLDVYLVPFSTGTVDTNAILPTSVITEGTTGVYYSTAALVKTAGRHVRLTEKCWVIVVFTPGAADATAGKATFVLPFSHDLVSTSY
jgi:hypothetical protein